MSPEPRWPIAREAWPLAAIPAGAAAVAWILGFGWVAAVALAVAVGVVAFFRDPGRRSSLDDALVLAPADGRVVESRAEPGGPSRVGIFLSVFDVHINRVPVSGDVVRVERTAGGFGAAFRAAASTDNERVAVTIRTPLGEVDCIQIAGLVARRIVCRLAPGDRVEAGERYGLIRFGSRVEVRLPAGTELLVAVGDRTRGGITPLARWTAGTTP